MFSGTIRFPCNKTIVRALTLDRKASKSGQENAVLATKIGATVNVFLAAAKGASGYTIGSTALIADSFNSLGDLFCDAVVYFTITEARKAPSKHAPWGKDPFI